MPTALRSCLRPVIRRLISSAPRLTTLALGLVLSGCLSRPSLPRQLFLVSPDPAGAPTAPQSPADRVLGLTRVTVAPPFEDRSLVYRTGENTFEQDPYAEFLVDPDRMMDEAVRTWLRRTGLFREVVDRGSQIKPTLFGELRVTQLHGDFRPASPPAAVLRLEFALLNPGESPSRRAMFVREYARSIPLSERSAVALVAGWSQALREILTELTEELSKLAAESDPASKPVR